MGEPRDTEDTPAGASESTVPLEPRHVPLVMRIYGAAFQILGTLVCIASIASAVATVVGPESWFGPSAGALVFAAIAFWAYRVYRIGRALSEGDSKAPLRACLAGILSCVAVFLVELLRADLLVGVVIPILIIAPLLALWAMTRK